MITELRRYRIKPGRMASWVAFLREAARENEHSGSVVEYAGVDAETNTFVWLRSFADEADREARKNAFYGSAWWVERERFAMDHVLEYRVTFLETALHRAADDLQDVAWPPPAEAAGERPGSRGDDPPDGWAVSTRQTYVPIAGTD